MPSIDDRFPWDFYPARALYSLVYGGLALGYHVWQTRRRDIPAEALTERRGKPTAAHAGAPFWVHASSMGEVRVAAGLIDGLAGRRPSAEFVLTVSTETGYQLGQSIAPAGTTVVRAPIDAMRFVRSFLDRVRPCALVLIETEWWPNQLVECSRKRIPVFVASGRVGAAAGRRYRLVRHYVRPLLNRIERFYMRSAADAARLLALGVDPRRVEVTGSLKNIAAGGTPVARSTVPAGPPVFMAGCTRPGEEEIVLEAFRLARKRIGDLRLWLAPRHPERFDDVRQLIAHSGYSWAAFSAVSGEPSTSENAPDVLLIDAMGVLAGLYQRARVAFVGGSLRPFGGHNPVEPVQAGAPVLFGPHTEEQTEAATALEQAGLGQRVSDAQSLADAVVRVIMAPGGFDEWNRQRAGFLARNREAVNHVAEDILRRVERLRSSAEAGGRR